MALEDLQKIVDLMLKGVAATAIAAGGLYVSLTKNRLDQGAACLNMSEKLYAPMDATVSLERKQHRMSLLIDKYNETCGQLSASETDFLMNSLSPTQLAVAESAAVVPHIKAMGADSIIQPKVLLPAANNAEPLAPMDQQADLGNSGWVAVGRINGTYGQINFDNADELLVHPLPQGIKKVLKARWSVNLRDNTTNTKLGANPVKKTLDAGDCIEAGALEEVRGQIWTNANVTNCLP